MVEICLLPATSIHLTLYLVTKAYLLQLTDYSRYEVVVMTCTLSQYASWKFKSTYFFTTVFIPE